MRFLFLLLLLLAGAPAYPQKALRSEVFQANVKPVLNGIVRDFYQMIELFPNYPKKLNPLMEDFEGITAEREVLLETCPRLLSKRCEEPIRNLREKLGRLKTRSLELLKEQKMTSALYINTLAGVRVISDFDNAVEELKGDLDNASFIQAADISQRKETYGVVKKVDELGTLLSLAVVEYIPQLYKEEFRHFFFNFVHPVQLQLSKRSNFEYLNQNVNSLNFTLNLLNMNLTKKNKKTPEGMAPFLAVIHNKWNSLLRYYL